MTPAEPLRAPAAMRPRTMLHLYLVRLRAHIAQELLAAVGVAIAVALVFATLVADGSVVGSTSKVTGAFAGPARLQLRARGPDGFGEDLIDRVKRLPDVAQAAALLEQPAGVSVAGRAPVSVELVGVDVGLATLDGLVHTLPEAVLAAGGTGITIATARALGLPPAGSRESSRPTVTLTLRGRAHALKASSVLGSRSVGVLAGTHVLLISLQRLRTLAGLPHRLTRILVVPRRGRDGAARAELRGLAGDRLTVAPVSQEAALLAQALRPSGQASALFAAISALLGFLFAFTALLLTVPERRLTIADLSIGGARRTAIGQLVLFESLCLGIVACLLGIAGGLLTLHAFGQPSGYLARAFTLGGETVVGFTPLLGALLVGLLATGLASVVPLLDLRGERASPGRAREALGGVPGGALDARAQRLLVLAAGAPLLAAGVLVALVPSAAVIACALLALAIVLAVPLVLATVLRVAGAAVRRRDGPSLLSVVLTSLRATELRSLALAATGAVAIFGSVALGGSRGDLLAGIHAFTAGYTADADIWIVNPGDNQAIDPFASQRLSVRLAALPAVAHVNVFQGSFLDLDGRRAWVLAWPSTSRIALLSGQIVRGNAAAAVARLRRGGWIAVSDRIARGRGLGVGDRLVLPVPTGDATFRIAATTTNFGWSPGAILMSTADYSGAWATHAPSALGVTLAPHTSLAVVRGEIERVLGPGSGLEVLAARARAARIDASAGEGLSQLGEIAGMLALAAILALIAALGAGIWQSRRALAALRLEGTPPARLRRMLLLEGALILGAGSCTGVVGGIYGQAAIDGYLRSVTGFPVLRTGVAALPLEVLGIVLLTVILSAALPAWFASRVPATLAFDER